MVTNNILLSTTAFVSASTSNVFLQISLRRNHSLLISPLTIAFNVRG